MKKDKQFLSPDTEIEVVSQNKTTGKVYSKIITLKQWQSMERKPNYFYKAYQIGYYQNKDKIKC